MGQTIGNAWEASAKIVSATQAKTLKAAPARGLSHYVTGILLSGGDGDDGIAIPRNYGVLLAAADETVTWGDDTDLYLDGDEVSIEIVAKFGANAAMADFIQKGTSGNHYTIELTSDGYPKFTGSDGSTTFTCTGDQAVGDGRWHQICFVMDDSGADSIDLYIDGVLNTSGPDDGSDSVGYTIDGRITGAGSDLVLQGIASQEITVARFGLFNETALTAAQVADLWNSGNPSKYTDATTGLADGWNLDGSHVTLASGNVPPISGGVAGVIANATRTAGAGFPLDDNSTDQPNFPMDNIITCANNGDTVLYEFPSPIRVGNGQPLNIYPADDGTFDVVVFGFTDSV